MINMTLNCQVVIVAASLTSSVIYIFNNSEQKKILPERISDTLLSRVAEAIS